MGEAAGSGAGLQPGNGAVTPSRLLGLYRLHIALSLTLLWGIQVPAPLPQDITVFIRQYNFMFDHQMALGVS